MPSYYEWETSADHHEAMANNPDNAACLTFEDCAWQLWRILDDIDTATDAIDSREEFYQYVGDAVQRRFNHARPLAGSGELQWCHRHAKPEA